MSCTTGSVVLTRILPAARSEACVATCAAHGVVVAREQPGLCLLVRPRPGRIVCHNLKPPRERQLRRGELTRMTVADISLAPPTDRQDSDERQRPETLDPPPQRRMGDQPNAARRRGRNLARPSISCERSTRSDGGQRGAPDNRRPAVRGRRRVRPDRATSSKGARRRPRLCSTTGRKSDFLTRMSHEIRTPLNADRSA